MSRYHLTIAALQRSTWLRSRAGGVMDQFEERLAAHQAYIKEHHEDLPEILN
jgi:xylulose-5-phosphate/fructose-6-phosphate phosphoketolase